jgi:hypothetical protein
MPILVGRDNDGASSTRKYLPSSRAVAWLWALLPCSLLVALGANTPVYRWLFEHVVFFRLTRVPVRWLEVWAFCAALLAGFTFDAVLHRARINDQARTVQRVLGAFVRRPGSAGACFRPGGRRCAVVDEPGTPPGA